MPIYAYRCESCGHQLDVLQKMSDAKLVDCPACGKPTFQKQVTAAGFQLKGSGWYVTDFRDTGKKDPAKKTAEGADAAPPAADAKPAATDASAPPAAAPAATPGATPATAPAPAPTPAKSPPPGGST